MAFPARRASAKKFYQLASAYVNPKYSRKVREKFGKNSGKIREKFRKIAPFHRHKPEADKPHRSNRRPPIAAAHVQ
jgi:hypothetical protein